MEYSLQAAEVCGSLEIDSAIDTVRALANEMAEAKREAHQGKLLPLPGETVENCALELGATSKTVGSSMAQLLTAANQGVWVGGCGISNLNLSCDRPLLELLKECFSFKIDSSKLKLRAVKEIASNRNLS